MVWVCVSLVANDVEHLVMGFLWVFFGEIPIQILCPYFKLDYYIFIIGCKESFIYSGHYSLIRYMLCKEDFLKSIVLFIQLVVHASGKYLEI